VPAGVALAICRRRKAVGVAQPSIEILIGRLLTDEAFRIAFLENREITLQGFSEAGYELTPIEIAAVLSTPTDVWSRAADRLDPRLQKSSLRHFRGGQHGD
jgi:hypothetical protein